MLELSVNSCDGSLINIIEEKCDTLDEPEQGGIAYLKIEFYNIFKIINVVIASLHDFINNFSKDGVANVPNKKIGSDSENKCCIWALR